MNNKDQRLLIKYIEKSFDHGPSKKWQNRDYEDLSFQVRHATKVHLSVATLKRFFGKVRVSENYTPQRSTIEALMLYSGYEARIQAAQARYKRSRRIVLTSMALLVVLSGLLLYLDDSDTSSLVTGNLTLRKLEGKCPSTAYFDVDLQHKQDSSFLHFGDLSTPKPLRAGRYDLTHFYAYPGRFEARLLHANETIARVPVLVETDGWQSFAHYYENLVERYYPIPVAENVADKQFHISSKRLRGVGLDTTKLVVVRLDHFKATTQSADRFEFLSRLKNDTFWPGVRCYSVIISIQGTAGKAEFKLGAEGCSGFSQVILGDEVIDTSNNPRPLVMDMSHWNEMEIRNTNKNIELRINDQLLFSHSYEASLGKLFGTSIIFHGSGTVDYVNLTAAGETVFETGF